MPCSSCSPKGHVRACSCLFFADDAWSLGAVCSLSCAYYLLCPSILLLGPRHRRYMVFVRETRPKVVKGNTGEFFCLVIFLVVVVVVVVLHAATKNTARSDVGRKVQRRDRPA